MCNKHEMPMQVIKRYADMSNIPSQSGTFLVELFQPWCLEIFLCRKDLCSRYAICFGTEAADSSLLEQEFNPLFSLFYLLKYLWGNAFRKLYLNIIKKLLGIIIIDFPNILVE